MKKIIFILPNLSGGGAEKVILKLAEFLNSTNKVKADILIFKNKFDYDASSFSGKIISIFPENKKIKKIFFPFIFKLYKNFKNYDILIGGLELFPSYSAVLIGKIQRKKIILMNHTFLSEYIKKKCSKQKCILHKILTIIINRFANKIVSVSIQSMKDLEKKFFLPKKKLTYIYNPIDLKEIKKLSKEPLEETYKSIFFKKTIISVGRLDYQKGFDLLINAVSLIKNLDFNLAILGQGEDETKLKNLTKKLNLDKKIFFLGFQKNPFKFLKHSIFYVLPSRFEGFPMALIEAMAVGLPVISTNCQSGPAEILKNGEYGTLVPVENFEELAEAIKNYLNDDKLLKHFSEKSIQRAKDFDITIIGNKWLDLLKNL